MIDRIRRAIRIFFLEAERFGHVIDSTLAYNCGDWDGYVFSNRRAVALESEIIKLRIGMK